MDNLIMIMHSANMAARAISTLMLQSTHSGLDSLTIHTHKHSPISVT
jgi:hypothetical protein